MISILYGRKNDFTKSNVYFERQLSIVKETNDVKSEASALNGLGQNYGRMGRDYGNAMAYLEQALGFESERGDVRIGMTYSTMGDVLVAQEGHEKEAILMYQNSFGLFEEANLSEALVRVFLKLGDAYTKIRAWDDAIASLEESISITDSIEDERLRNQLHVFGKQSLRSSIVLTDHLLIFLSEMTNSSAKHYSGLKPPSSVK